eukprot:SAG11_NODE_10655_length_814_cov_0.759441_2_plen_127_part_01
MKASCEDEERCRGWEECFEGVACVCDGMAFKDFGKDGRDFTSMASPNTSAIIKDGTSCQGASAHVLAYPIPPPFTDPMRNGYHKCKAGGVDGGKPGFDAVVKKSLKLGETNEVIYPSWCRWAFPKKL